MRRFFKLLAGIIFRKRLYLSIFMLCIIPLVVVSYVLLSNVEQEIHTINHEIDGAYLHHELFDTLITLQRFRGKSFVADNLNTILPEVKTYREEVENKITSLDKGQNEIKSLDLYDPWQALKINIEDALKPHANLDPLARFEWRTTIINQLITFMRDVSNITSLVADHETENYYVAVILTQDIPSIAAQLGYIRGKLSGIIANNILTGAENDKISEYIGQLKIITYNYRQSISAISEFDIINDLSLVEADINAIGGINALVKKLELFAADPVANSLSHEDFFNQSTNTIFAFQEIYDRLHTYLVVELQERLRQEKIERFEIIAVMTFFFIVFTALFFYFQKNLVKRQELTNARQITTILNTVIDGIITFDARGIIFNINPAITDIFDYQPDELIGKNILKLMPKPYTPDKITKLISVVNKHDMRQEAGYEVEGIRKNGTIFPMEIGINSFTADKENVFVAIIRDISERKELEKERKLLGSIVESSQDAIVSKDMNGIIMSWNKGAEKLFGFKSHEVIGKNIDFLIPKSRVIEEGIIVDRIKEGQMPTQYETKRAGKDGKMLDIAITASPIFDNQGNVIGISKVAHDISERKRAMEKMTYYAQQLKEKNRELEVARSQAEHANSMKSDFLATMSHEIRTPMNGIIGMTELLLGSNLSLKQQDYARTVLNSAESLLSIINDVLDFSKIESGKLELEKIPFDLQNLIDDTIELMTVKAKEKALEVVLRFIPTTPSRVIGDPTRVRQIVTNLMGNAIKFTEKGHVLVKAESIPHTNPQPGKMLLKITVEDTGIGISENAQKKLFQKFSQIDASTTRKYGGTGLGLAICKQLAEMMNGTIGFSSTPGKGSSFWFTTELEIDTAAATAATNTSLFEEIKGLRALIVDDLPDNILVVKEQLEAVGIDCITCGDSENAIAILTEAKQQGKPIDFALIDYLMPELNGEELARKIKAADSFVKDTILIILTSAGGQGFAKQFATAGISAYLSKPIHSRQLLSTIKEVWRAWKNGDVDTLITAENVRTKLKGTDIYKFNGAKILLVEDNRVNQEFALEILESLGVKTDLAINGQDAIGKCLDHTFDLILMDCQMPIMDGFLASQHLCTYWQDHGKTKTPIIALTANAMEGDRDKCLAAGMADYIAKPMRKNDIVQALTKWLPSNVVQKIDVIQADQKTQKPFNKANILLVEDNRVNREFAEEILESAGCLVTAAENGKIALQKINTHSFDLILMDIQMPEMDGLEATKAIRGLSNEKLAHIPIIAVTANAMKGYREECLAVGMDDYIAKPYKPALLIEKLHHWLPPHRKTSEIAANDDADLILDRGALYQLNNILQNKIGLFIKMYLEDSTFTIDNLKRLCAASRPADDIILLAHTLKSTSEQVGALQVAYIAGKIQNQAADMIRQHIDDTTILHSIIHQLEKAFETLSPVLTQEIDSLMSTYPKPTAA